MEGERGQDERGKEGVRGGAREEQRVRKVKTKHVIYEQQT